MGRSKPKSGGTGAGAGSGRSGKKRPARRPIQNESGSDAEESSETADSDEIFATPAIPAARKGKLKAKVQQKYKSQPEPEPSTSQQSQSPGSSKANKSQSAKHTLSQLKKSAVQLSHEDLVTQGLQYLLTMQQKKIPLKKYDLLKNALNQQTDKYTVVIQEVSDVLEEVFGSKLIGLKLDEDGKLKEVDRVSEATFFIMISLYNCSILEADNVEEENQAHQGQELQTKTKDATKAAFLRIILNTIYMLNREIDEDFIWQIVLSMECQQEISPRREDLKKFLKTECVDPMYLNKKETKNNDTTVCRYSWGMRAELECDKYQILKHVAKTMGKTPQNFKTQFFDLIKDKKYEAAISADRNSQVVEENESMANASTENESADPTPSTSANATRVLSEEDMETEDILGTIPQSLQQNGHSSKPQSKITVKKSISSSESDEDSTTAEED